MKLKRSMMMSYSIIRNGKVLNNRLGSVETFERIGLEGDILVKDVVAVKKVDKVVKIVLDFKDKKIITFKESATIKEELPPLTFDKFTEFYNKYKAAKAPVEITGNIFEVFTDVEVL